MDGNLRYITKRRIGSENKCASLKSGEETTPVKRLKACDIHTGTPVVPSIQSRIKALAKRNHTPESPKVEKYAAKVDNKINNEKVQLFETPNKMITCEQSNKKEKDNEKLFENTIKENTQTFIHKSILKFCINSNEQNLKNNKENISEPNPLEQPFNEKYQEMATSPIIFTNPTSKAYNINVDVCDMSSNENKKIQDDIKDITNNDNLLNNHFDESVYDTNEDKMMSNNNKNIVTVNNKKNTEIITDDVNSKSDVSVTNGGIKNDMEAFNQCYDSFSADESINSTDVTPDHLAATIKAAASTINEAKNITGFSAGLKINEAVGSDEFSQHKIDNTECILSSVLHNDNVDDNSGTSDMQGSSNEKNINYNTYIKKNINTTDNNNNSNYTKKKKNNSKNTYDRSNNTKKTIKNNEDEFCKKEEGDASILRDGAKLRERVRSVGDDDQIKRFLGWQAQEEVVLRQAKNALKTFHENNSSHHSLHSNKTYVDCHRIILVSRLKIDFYEKELKRVRASMSGNKHLSESDSTISTSATFSISQLEIPLHPDLIKNMNERTEDSHHFVVVLSCGQQIFFSPLITAVKGVESLTLNGPFEFENIQSASTLKFEIYTMASSNESNEKSKKRSSLVNALATPIRKLLPSSSSDRLSKNFHFQPLHCNFLILGLCEVVVTTAFLSRVRMAFDQVPQNLRKLAGEVLMACSLNIRSLLQHKHFLTMFEDIHGLGVWQRRWCSLVGTKIYYWKYPEDEEDKPASGHIDLINCQYELAKMVTWEVCARPNTLQLVAWFESSTNKKSSLITTVTENEVNTKYWLSADTKEGCLKWCDVINHVIKDIRRWGGRGDEV